MTKTLKNGLLASVAAGVLALATAGAQAEAWTTAYKLGFNDGCDNAQMEDGYPTAHEAGPKALGEADYDDTSFDEGWNAGYLHCAFPADSVQLRTWIPSGE